MENTEIIDDLSFPWVEEFRPNKIEDVIGAEHLIEKMNEYIKEKSCPHLLFDGTAGVGKTTIAKILANNIAGKGNYLYINASDRNNIDTIRVDISNFCSVIGFNDNLKIIILDESDGLTPQAQKSLRAVMEEFAKTSRFILTCNYGNKIIDAIHSRCQRFEFRNASKGAIFKRCAEILVKKGVTILDSNKKIKPEIQKDLQELVKKFYPDIRSTINNLQKFTHGDTFKFDLSSVKDETSDLLIQYIKEGSIKKIREEILTGGNVDYTTLYNTIYSRVKEISDDFDKCSAILILTADYMYKHSFHLNPEINFVACILEIINNMK